ncbi:MAG: flavodoxin family protein [Chitinispirillaceae bacterium]|nr:flavodoxin family protein [Chitinispirillaceae bacterium]
MKIGIIVHSQSGYTAKVARLLGAGFSKRGDDTETVLLRTVGKVAPRSTSFEIRNAPAVEDYDLIILGAPVWAFSASPVIMKYLGQLGRLTGKKVLCFVTKALPFLWTGGTQALGLMEGELALSGADILPGEIIRAPAYRSEAKLRPVIDRIVAACTA